MSDRGVTAPKGRPTPKRAVGSTVASGQPHAGRKDTGRGGKGRVQRRFSFPGRPLSVRVGAALILVVLVAVFALQAIAPVNGGGSGKVAPERGGAPTVQSESPLGSTPGTTPGSLDPNDPKVQELIKQLEAKGIKLNPGG